MTRRAELRETLDLCREGKQLVELCCIGLQAVSGELSELDLDALVRRLEAAGNTESGASDEDVPF